MRSICIWSEVCFLVVMSTIVSSDGGETRTIYVSPTGDGTNGESWETAFKSINAAYVASVGGDSIHVEVGLYKETLLVNKNPIRLLGGLAGNKDLERSNTRIENNDRSILDANGGFSIVVNFFQDGQIDGFILQNSTGRGSFVHGKTVTFRNCEIRNHTNGGGVVIESATVEFHHCRIADNQCDREAGGIGAYFVCSVLLESSTIENNQGVYTGGIGAGRQTTLIARDCVIRNNRTTGGGIPGGGLQMADSNYILENCLFYGNSVNDANGAQIYKHHAGVCQMINCTVFGTSSQDVSWSTTNEDPSTIENCIFWGSNAILTNNASVTNSCIQGGYPGEGNISDDPLFRNAAAGDFRLLPESPCIDTAGTSGPDDDLNGNFRPIDIAGIGREVTDTYDMGAYEFQLNELPTPTEPPAGVNPRHTGYYQ